MCCEIMRQSSSMTHGRNAAMTVSSGFAVWTAQLTSASKRWKHQRFSVLFRAFHAVFSGLPISGPVQSSSGALVLPCKSSLVVLAGANGSSLWSTVIAPTNQIGGVAIVGGGAAGAARIVLTAFDGSLILFSPKEEQQQPQTQPVPATTFATSLPLTSSAPTPAANQTNQSTVIKPPVIAVPAPPGSTPSPPPSNSPSVPFAGAHVP